MNIQRFIFAIICVVTIGPSLAFADRYESARGYAFDVPDGWLIADADFRGDAAQEAMRIFNNLRDADFRKMDVVIFDPQKDGFADNINVVVHNERVPVKEKIREQLGRGMLDNYVSLGFQPKAFTSEIRIVGENKCMIFTFNAEAGEVSIWMRQYIISGKEVAYIVTCTASADHQNTYAVQFEDVMKSFMVVGGAPGWWDSLTDIAKSTIIGAVIGAVVLGGGSLVLDRIKGAMKPKGTEVSPTDSD